MLNLEHWGGRRKCLCLSHSFPPWFVYGLVNEPDPSIDHVDQHYRILCHMMQPFQVYSSISDSVAKKQRFPLATTTQIRRWRCSYILIAYNIFFVLIISWVTCFPNLFVLTLVCFIESLLSCESQKTSCLHIC